MEKEFNGGATARFQSEDLKKYRLDEKAPTLIVLLGPDTGARIPLVQPEVTLGRTTDADIVLHDEQISRRHALIRCDPERYIYTLVDLNSTNGTRVNLKPITEVNLQEGDKIFIGSTVLKFVLQDEVESKHGDVVNRWAFTDDLTGLVVKRRLQSQLRFEIHWALERSEALALLMMDLDGLKQINDAHGHATGAFIISQVGRLIGEICNPLGQVCRFGGDEFLAYLLRHDLESGMRVGDQIRETIENRVFEKDLKEFKVTISIGVAVLPIHARELEALINAADQALYRAKAKGRNCTSD